MWKKLPAKLANSLAKQSKKNKNQTKNKQNEKVARQKIDDEKKSEHDEKEECKETNVQQQVASEPLKEFVVKGKYVARLNNLLKDLTLDHALQTFASELEQHVAKMH